MNIEQHLTTEWFWAAATSLLALAGLIGGVTSWAVAGFIKRRERPEPEWISWMHGQAHVNDRYGSPDGISVKGTIENAGEGDAFNVRIEGVECKAGFPQQADTVLNRRGVMRAGDTTAFWCSIDLDTWESARVRITWTEPPTRLRRQRSFLIAPSAEIERPGVEYFNPRSGKYETRTAE